VSVEAWSWVLRESTSRGTDRLVLLALANAANSEGEGVATTDLLAKDSHLDRRTVQRSLRRLERDRVIAIRRGGGRGRKTTFRIVAMERRSA
jgi:DNA-binding transcriptional regulator YhcF (GntR family)